MDAIAILQSGYIDPSSETYTHIGLDLLPEHYERYRLIAERKKREINSHKFLDSSTFDFCRETGEDDITTITPAEDTMLNDDCYTVTQLAEKLNIKPTSVGSLVRWGKIPRSVLVSRGRYKRDVIDAMIADGSLNYANLSNEKSKCKAPTLICPEPIKLPQSIFVPPPAEQSKSTEPFVHTMPQEFVREFWRTNDYGIRILMLPSSETREAVIRAVTEALKYAHAKMQRNRQSTKKE